MRHALIIAGGSGTRLWPMSTKQLPKQLIPFIAGRSLVEVAFSRLEGLVPAERIHVCAGEGHREAMLACVAGLSASRFIGEPVGRDTLNAVGLGTAVIAAQDPGAVVAVFTADHVIRPEAEFRRIVEQGYRVAEQRDDALVTFGIEPTQAATGYGYLQLGADLDGAAGAFAVDQFKEKPDQATAERYVAAGPTRYLWNSGMFVWRADTLLRCLEKYEPDNHAGLQRCAGAWGGDDWSRVLGEVYPSLKKISVDYAIMEPASQDAAVAVAAVPMPLQWLDVGSWPSFAEVCPGDDQGNALGGGKHVMIGSTNTLVASSESGHLIATVGVEDLIVIHTPQATLVCRRDQAERIKELQQQVADAFEGEYV